VALGGALAAAAIDVRSTKRQNPVTLLDARGPDLRQLRLARDNRGDGDAQVAKPKGGVSGDGGHSVMARVRSYAVTLHCTSVYVRIVTLPRWPI
jgi:hypothetical protein